MTEQYRVLNDELIPALRDAGIRFVRRDDWSPAQRSWLEQYFRTEIVPLLSPTTLDPTRPFPRILNKSLNFIVSLDGRDAFGRPCHRAIVQAPRSLPRLIPLPPTLEGTGKVGFRLPVVGDPRLRRSAVRRHGDRRLLPVPRHAQQRSVHRRRRRRRLDDRARRRAIREPLRRRQCASRPRTTVRRSSRSTCSSTFRLTRADLYQVPGPVNLNRLLAVYDLVDRPELKYAPFTPGVPKSLVKTNIFEAISKHDILLHHPFESFAPVIDFIYRAATDPDVLAIKQTLYRTTPDSPLVESLVSAAKAGKEVTVLIELRARFDEAANIELASKLQEAGAHVVYGVVGYKTHCKMALVVRREHGKLRRYVHLGTGNYHPRTARAYTDYGLLSANERARRGRAPGLHAADEPDAHDGSEPPVAVAVQSARTLAGVHSPRDTQRRDRRHGPHHREAQRARRARGHPRALRSVRRRRLRRPDRARHLLPAARGSPACPTTSACARSSAASWSTAASTTSTTAATKSSTARAPTGWSAISSAGSSSCSRSAIRGSKARVMADLDTYLADNVQAWELRKDGRYEQLRASRRPRRHAGAVEAAAPARRSVLTATRGSRA